MNDQQQSRADALTSMFAAHPQLKDDRAVFLASQVRAMLRNVLADSANETGAEGAAITDHDAKGLEIIAGWLYKDGLVEPAAMLRRLASARSPAMAAEAPADEHSTIECQAHSGPDCTECGGTGAWSGSADERAALQWAAGTLQEIVSGRWKGAKESDKVSIGSVTKTVAQVLDMADAALGRASQGDAPAEMRKPDAYVPIHPRNGPLWASAVTSLDADRPKSYPVQAVYLGASTAALSAARAAASPAADDRKYTQADMERYGRAVANAREKRTTAAAQPAQASAAAVIPEGWKLVPTEPTMEMQIAARRADKEYQERMGLPDYIGVGGYDHYVAMLHAAPQPAQADAPAEARLTDEQREAIEWAADSASKYARPISGETLMMRRERALRALLNGADHADQA
ncbi:putative gp43 [Burkholderia thailandensis MSMB59]|uniref:hypothetical protein n=1 Tax=Burkholderia thailandensis TaxID=57975 RepID=UPI00051531D1|nr:hypothetical protein [Burkholderia thailandensis]AIS95402.1 putative gp43 [Burkholderia thailandensis MSMB59]